MTHKGTGGNAKSARNALTAPNAKHWIQAQQEGGPPHKLHWHNQKRLRVTSRGEPNTPTQQQRPGQVHQTLSARRQDLIAIAHCQKERQRDARGGPSCMEHAFIVCCKEPCSKCTGAGAFMLLETWQSTPELSLIRGSRYCAQNMSTWQTPFQPSLGGGATQLLFNWKGSQ